MLYYPNNYKVETIDNNRFILPFLGGALIGGAAVGITRPRPIYNVAPYPVYPNYGRPPYVPYANFNYNYYYPRPY